MFTKHDMRDYFLQIIETEQKMNAFYRNLVANLSHAEYKSLFHDLAREEAQHARQAKELLRFFTEENDEKSSRNPEGA